MPRGQTLLLGASMIDDRRGASAELVPQPRWDSETVYVVWIVGAALDKSASWAKM